MRGVRDDHVHAVNHADDGNDRGHSAGDGRYQHVARTFRGSPRHNFLRVGGLDLRFNAKLAQPQRRTAPCASPSSRSLSSRSSSSGSFHCWLIGARSCKFRVCILDRSMPSTAAGDNNLAALGYGEANAVSVALRAFASDHAPIGLTLALGIIRKISANHLTAVDAVGHAFRRCVPRQTKDRDEYADGNA